MKRPLRPLTGVTVLASLALAVGCSSAPTDPMSHWNVDSVGDRMVRHFLGYRGELDGSYLEFQAAKKRHVSSTLRRHFLNHNGDNPLQAYNPRRIQPRRAHGPLPDPSAWFHAESVVWGTAIAVASGTFVPLPVDSILALGSDGGTGEFLGTFVGDFKTGDLQPPAVADFRVKNR